MKHYILLLCAALGILPLKAQQRAVLTGTITADTAWDYISLRVWDETLTPRTIADLPTRNFNADIHNGQFRFEVPDIKKPVYITLGKFNKVSREFLYMMEQTLLEPGDSLNLQLTGVTGRYRKIPEIAEPWLAGYGVAAIKITGRGAARMELTRALQAEENRFQDSMSKLGRRVELPQTVAYMDSSMPIFDYKLRTQLQILALFRSRLSKAMYQLQYADITAANYVSRYEHLHLSVLQVRRGLPEQYPAALAAAKRLYKPANLRDLPAVTLANSTHYIDLLAMEGRFLSLLNGDNIAPYKYIQQHNKGILRDKAITAYFLESGRNISDLKAQLDDALSFTKDPFCVNLLKETARISTAGMPAFNFSLPDTAGKIVTLADLKGKTVFVDFWYTGCGACSGFYKSSLSKVEAALLNNPDVVFVTISVDKNRNTWINSVRKDEYTSAGKANVINLYTAGQGPDHDLVKWYKVKGYPHQLLIGKDGRIIRASKLQLPEQQLLAVIKEALTTQR
ncbi:TlpA family protein disulfide reductase [Chitinophaga horti]|uniref:TlpA family protein disulfide reductase n=1 Tax=Chitinophaga horti TaxID=2920382 RepID=A0ABY6J953_9BACT|nr:TlpA disulfide reductase family protein [Chitinophaga horti]UYQ94811.1 TlpA family protein disulfide reductase [Chitinophaga horti]